MTCTNYTTAVTFKENLERNLETQKTEEQTEILGDSDTELPMQTQRSGTGDKSKPNATTNLFKGVKESILEWD
jgi:hypothetical protein